MRHYCRNGGIQKETYNQLREKLWDEFQAMDTSEFFLGKI